MLVFHQGDFTLPGEAGYEALTLALARKWGADVIRDSDGTKLSDEIVSAGYRIYSTICIIRQHNAFAEAHPDAQQQTFLISEPVIAESEHVDISLIKGYYTEQFELNTDEDSLAYWQVWDRTENVEIPREQWHYEDGRVVVDGCKPWHSYTASFLCWRVWEEINMYNHTTNGWTSAHLRQLDPRHPAAWKYLRDWLENWCVENPQTNVVRLTSLFYNFVWIWGDDARHRNRFTDWASYDFTVSPAALKAFEAQYGYALTAEDFVNSGKFQVTHMPPTKAKRDYMSFIHAFVADKARELVEIIHRHGKLAYVFYDDSWVGMEPYGGHFGDIGLDGIIKCVFSGFECRLCAGVNTPTHELRFHPYLFPVGLGGLPTFSEGGHPEKDAMEYWLHVRRALARQSVDRIGLGGYLHLTEGCPQFVDVIEQMAMDFRRLKALHSHGAPYVLPCRVAVLHTWGSLRPWTLSGHFHETFMHPLIHINEALSGLPVDVKFISFEDAENGILDNVDVVINAGRAGDAWSGGEAWHSTRLVEALTEFVHRGGTFIGVGQPSAVPGHDTFFRMAHVLGIDEDTGARVCHGRWTFAAETDSRIRVLADCLGNNHNLYLTDGRVRVLCAKDGVPQMTLRSFGKGMGIYMSGFSVNPESTAMLLDLLRLACGHGDGKYIPGDRRVEAAYFPVDKTLVAMNNSEQPVETTVLTDEGELRLALSPLEMKFVLL
ncbi:MAG: 1,3-beta-galactosyl-N-acetylhexosamine phosphorylase [Clostridia bacterium]|nr:1,3-beta-galactosyl-N-acetylhexosamine phosphorylase [Clostridia bacterium]